MFSVWQAMDPHTSCGIHVDMEAPVFSEINTVTANQIAADKEL